MDRLGIGFLGGFGLPPVEFVNLTADLGCGYMSVVVRGFPLVPLGYQPFSLKDAALRREMLAAMNHRGVTTSLGDGFLVLRRSPSFIVSQATHYSWTTRRVAGGIFRAARYPLSRWRAGR